MLCYFFSFVFFFSQSKKNQKTKEQTLPAKTQNLHSNYTVIKFSLSLQSSDDNCHHI